MDVGLVKTNVEGGQVVYLETNEGEASLLSFEGYEEGAQLGRNNGHGRGVESSQRVDIQERRVN